VTQQFNTLADVAAPDSLAGTASNPVRAFLGAPSRTIRRRSPLKASSHMRDVHRAFEAAAERGPVLKSALPISAISPLRRPPGLRRNGPRSSAAARRRPHGRRSKMSFFARRGLGGEPRPRSGPMTSPRRRPDLVIAHTAAIRALVAQGRARARPQP